MPATNADDRQKLAAAHQRSLAKRQRVLAQQIGIKFLASYTMIPLVGYGVPSLGDAFLISWRDRPLIDLAWWAVADQIDACADGRHIIDHAWMAGFDAPGPARHEPWALVIEPYIEDAAAREVALLANLTLEDWPVDVHLLPAAESAWSPGQTRPIVAVLKPRGCERLLRRAIPWALDRLGELE